MEDRGALQATIHRVAKSWTHSSDHMQNIWQDWVVKKPGPGRGEGVTVGT